MGRYYADRFYGLLANHESFLPYASRSIMLQEETGNYPDEVRTLLTSMDVLKNKIAEEAALDFEARDRQFLEYFMDPEILEARDELFNWELNVEGTFSPFSEAPDGDVQIDGTELIRTVPLDKNASLFERAYENQDEAINEIKKKVTTAGIELPDDFDWAGVIGLFDCIQYDG